ncbi:MAG: hypothetical protein ABR518_07975, partial [Actinomycetota bacterium]
GESRRGSVAIGRTLRAGRSEVLVDRFEMTPDHAAVVWRPSDPAVAATAVLIADGSAVEPLPADASGGSRVPAGDVRTLFYPIPRTARLANVLVRGPGGAESPTIRVPLS